MFSSGLGALVKMHEPDDKKVGLADFGHPEKYYYCVMYRWCKLGAAPDAVDLAMQTPLHVACANDHVECASLLLRAEASAPQAPAVLFNADEEYGGLPTRRNIGGGTAMHEAARAGSPECVELLLSANARVESATDGATDKYIFLGVSAKDLEGSTPLHVACENVHAECALYLVAANAEVDTEDANGRSPLLLVCEAANDPAKEAHGVQIIEKLLATGAAMNESGNVDHSNGSEGSASLLLDRIESPELRHELEVLYLRHEAQSAKQSNVQLRKEDGDVVKRIQGLEDELTTLCIQISYGKQASPTLQDTVGTPLLATTLGDATGKSDEELALEAALARDLGKKCVRQSQSVLAEKYFQRSLELMPLPGVHRLLDAARKAQHRDPKEGSTPLVAAPYANGTSSVPQPREKAAKIQQLGELFLKANATPQAFAMLDKELSKLSLIFDDAEFAFACRWVELLVALPWGIPTLDCKATTSALASEASSNSSMQSMPEACWPIESKLHAPSTAHFVNAMQFTYELEQ
ncbi:hypothetical protein PHYPSEUDO_002599 [Phytophthora pseudosyringae]|uniref:Uncharacterized protein n=1 Tax=Phytophthora pseudosyringae TaxID=221518 RepID=A0A8T1VTA6_9STRA|nr:hypothetical protein PHYPSEUDO_002599 [Phytophthora pseudosyringae]